MNKTKKSYKAVPENRMIVGEDVYLSMDCYETQLNNNVLVVGTSGAGKTRKVVEPNLLQANSSYVISDPKGSLVKKYREYLEEKGYKVLTLDFIHPESSARYNPVVRCRNTDDIQKLASTLVYEMYASTRGGGTNFDPFWDEATAILLMALIAFVLESDFFAGTDRTLFKISELVTKATMDDSGRRTKLDEIMHTHEMRMHAKGLDSWAVRRYREYSTAPEKTHNTINITTLAKMVGFDTYELRRMLCENDLDFKMIGQEKTALFVQVSDTDRSKDVLVNLLYSQLMNELCDYADSCPGSHLPVPVQFILDDFATNARINHFENIISNIRSRWISTMIMVQSEAQLRAGYGDNAQTIVDNCNTYIYMGGSSPEQAEKIAKRANKTVNTILNMPVMMSWVFRRGQEPVLCRNFDLEWFQKEKGWHTKAWEDTARPYADWKVVRDDVPADKEGGKGNV